MAEVPQSSFIQFQDLLGENPIEGKESADLSLVGIIRFDKGRQMIKLIEERDGRLHSVYERTPVDFQTRQIIDEGNRVLDLTDFNEVKVAQLGMTDEVEVATYETSQTYPSVNIRFTYTDPLDQRKATFTLDEQEVLDIFTNKSGGHVIFSGAHLPPEEALFIERSVGQKKGAFLFLFHEGALGESRTSWGSNSAQGLGLFLRGLNREFEREAHLPLQEEWLTVLNEALENGLLEFPSSVRSQLFRTVLVAHARMAAKSGEVKYREFLDLCFPEVLEKHGHRLLGSLKPQVRVKRGVDKQVIDQSMNRLLVKERATVGKEAEELKPVPERLKTEEAKSLREGFPKLIGDNPQTRAYIQGLVHLAGEFDSQDQFNDIELLLNELRESIQAANIDRVFEFIRCLINFNDENRRGGFAIEFASLSGRPRNGLRLLDILHGAILRRKNHLVALNEFSRETKLEEEPIQGDPLTLLKTNRARQIYTSAGTAWGFSSDTMFSVMNEIAQLVKDCKVEDEFHDARMLLEVLKETWYGGDHSWIYKLHFLRPWGKPLERVRAWRPLLGKVYYGSDNLIDALMVKLVEKRKEIRASEVPKLPRPR